MISIGLPAVKPAFLTDAIKSVLEQRYPDFELIIVNDRKDETIRRIAGSFSDKRIRYYEEDTILPIVKNWNRTLSYARGEYFILFSDDDLYHQDFLSELSGLAQRYPLCNLFHCRVNKLSLSGNVYTSTKICPEFESGLTFILQRLKNSREQFVPEFMVKTDKIKEQGGFVDLPLAWGSDDLTWFSLATDGGAAYCSKDLVYWRESTSQVSFSGSIPQRLIAVKEYQKWIKHFVETIPVKTEEEFKLLEQIKSLIPYNAENQKIFLLAIHSERESLYNHCKFYFQNRKTNELKFKWFLYSIYHSIWKQTKII
ncbi:MAG: glycosyltransferase family A protein [Saccharofermentanaceae bacterium]|jgi:glycosyltransferase involved in cell wall biosynthesis|nr:glycosyltransferase family 2 protein [Bacteroidales bacterium]